MLKLKFQVPIINLNTEMKLDIASPEKMRLNAYISIIKFNMSRTRAGAKLSVSSYTAVEFST